MRHRVTARTRLVNAPTSDVDLLAPDAIADPHAIFAALREMGPIVWLTRHRAWMFTTHEAVRLGFHDQRLSSDRLTPLEGRLDDASRAAMGQTFDLLRGWMVFHDEPEHARLREPLRRTFTPSRVTDLRPRIEEIVDELLDDLADIDEPDLVRDFAFPLPAIVIAELLGVPAEDRDDFKHWSDQLAAIVFGSANRTAGIERAAAGSAKFVDYFTGLVDRYTSEPTNNLISALIAVTSDDPDAGLAPTELVGALTLLLFGGHETTTNLISNSMHSLLQHPAQQRLLRSRPEQLSGALEELHRFDGSTMWCCARPTSATASRWKQARPCFWACSAPTAIRSCLRTPTICTSTARTPDHIWATDTAATSASARRSLGWKPRLQSAA